MFVFGDGDIVCIYILCRRRIYLNLVVLAFIILWMVEVFVFLCGDNDTCTFWGDDNEHSFSLLSCKRILVDTVVMLVVAETL